MGVDQQLEKGIEVILQEMKSAPVTIPQPPSYPKR
jgi:hypothetical protein